MTSRIVVTGGAIIRDHMGRILLQKRSDYGDWGLPGGGMEPGEKLDHDQTTLLFKDEQNELLELVFKSLDEIDISTINKVQKPVLLDLMRGELTILR